MNGYDAVDFFQKKSWTREGFDTFTALWDTRNLADITYPVELRVLAVYQMLDEGLSVDEIAYRVKGIGRDRAESLRRQKAEGVPAEHASLSTIR
jgi:hypothetical protein